MMVAGALANHNLPVSQYPPIAPPSIAIDAIYRAPRPRPSKTASCRSSNRR
jgi:multidrug efflux pump subunit AcrB